MHAAGPGFGKGLSEARNITGTPPEFRRRANGSSHPRPPLYAALTIIAPMRDVGQIKR
jgi:hypothetical protein